MLLWGISMLGQTENVEVGGNYYFKNYPSVTLPTFLKIDDFSSPRTSSSFDFKVKNSRQDYKITVISIDDNSIVTFKYWRFTANASLETSFNGVNGELIYSMPLSEFKKMMGVYYDKYVWKVGFFTVPYKLRFKTFNFESDINVGANLSCKYRLDRKSENGLAIQPLIGIGITKINLDESNSKITSPGTASAFSINSGIIINITEKVNFGVFYGFDYLADKDNSKYDWIHNGNGWLGLGLNITFSEEDKNKASSGSN